MHISPRSVVSRMSRHVARCRSQGTRGGRGARRRARYRVSSLCLGGWADWHESRVRRTSSWGGPAYGCDEVESLRPDASLTMSLPARYLRARQPLAPRRYLARIRAMRLKSPRRRCSCTLGCSSRAARQLCRARSSTGIGRPNIIGTGHWGGLQWLPVCVVIGGSSPWNRRKIASRRRRKR